MNKRSYRVLGVLVACATLVVTVLGTCVAYSQSPQKEPARPGDEWIGLYTTTAEIRGKYMAAVVIERGPNGHLTHRSWLYSADVKGLGSPVSNHVGEATMRGERLYLANSHFSSPNNEVIRLTRRLVRGRTVLFTDYGLRLFEEKNRLHDYNLLIKVSDELPPQEKLKEVPHESVTVLYESGGTYWWDPLLDEPSARQDK